MKSDEIIRGIKQGQSEGKIFIKWWRRENDFTDYELSESFIANADPSHEIAGYELLDVDEMWDVLKRWKPNGLKRVLTDKGEMIKWQKKGVDGALEVRTCPLSAQAIMFIFDYETRGDVLG